MSEPDAPSSLHDLLAPPVNTVGQLREKLDLIEEHPLSRGNLAGAVDALKRDVRRVRLLL